MKFELQNEGTIYILYPRDQEARIWIEDHIDTDQTWCGGIVIQHRMVGPVLEGINEAGGTVNGV